MTSFFDYLMPQNTGFDDSQNANLRSQGMLNAGAALANLSAPGFSKATPTPLQLITGAMQGFQQGTQGGLDQFYTNEMNKSKAKQAGLDSTYADKIQPLMQGFDTTGFNTPPTAPRNPQLTDFYQPPIANPTAPQNARPVNNPGNLRPVGASTGFQQFSTPEEGMAALTRDLTAKINGSPAMGGRAPTLRNIISVYSPANENATTQLIENAARHTGLNPDQPLTMADLPKLQQAILIQEQGGTNGTPPATNMNPTTGAPMDPIAAGTVQQPSGVPGDAYLGNQLRTVGMLQAMAGKPTGDNLLKMGLMTDPRFSFMRNDNTPAVLQIANAMETARKGGNTDYLRAIATAGKFYDKGVTLDDANGVVPVDNYGDAVGSIAGTKKTYEKKAEAGVAKVTEIDSQLAELQQISGSINRFKEAVAETGMTGQVAGRYGNVTSDAGRTNLVSAQNELVLRAKSLLGMPSANFSDADRDFISAIAGGSFGSREGLSRVAARLEKMANEQVGKLVLKRAALTSDGKSPTPADNAGWSATRTK